MVPATRHASTPTLTPAQFYALAGDRAGQAAALAALTEQDREAFAAACADYLEARWGFAVPVLTVLAVWRNARLLAD